MRSSGWDHRSSTIETAFFVTLLATALAMAAAVAHALALANKLVLPQDEYFIVQKIYAGWNRLAFLLAVEVAGILTLLYLTWHMPRVRHAIAFALAGFVLAQGVFWSFTFPANAATLNWTIQPENWEALRRQWEFSHLAGAVFQTLTLSALIAAIIRYGRNR